MMNYLPNSGINSDDDQISKVDALALGLLWCQGTNEQRAEALWDMLEAQEADFQIFTKKKMFDNDSNKCIAINDSRFKAVLDTIL